MRVGARCRARRPTLELIGYLRGGRYDGVVGIDYVRDAPLRHTRSGIADVVSNLSTVADSRLTGEVIGEPVDGLAVATRSRGAPSHG